ncbi:MAG: ADP-heptose:LPS heptosyltransferase [Pseudohongiellaceae bacterium]|jgi:ADP-heptose:LPS heptosyltransferase
MPEQSSLLVIRLSSLGDVLFAVPAVQAIQDSQRFERVSWLVEDRAAGLLRDLVKVDELIVFPRKTASRWPAHAAGLAKRRDQVVLDFQCSMKSRLQRLFVKAPRSIGFDSPVAREGSERSLTEKIAPPPNARHRVDANLSLLPTLGIPIPPVVPRPRLQLPPDSVASARRQLLQGDTKRPLVILHPGTSAFGRLKRWDPHHFAELGARLIASHNAQIIVSGPPAEDELVAPILAHLGHRARRLPFGSIGQLASQLAAADLLIAADSFPLHLANALGTPVVGLYGPKNPAVNGPYFDRSLVVRSGIACSPCTLRRCAERLCMEVLSVDSVETAAQELLR